MEIRNSRGDVIFQFDGNLRKANLADADLSDAMLGGANLEGVVNMTIGPSFLNGLILRRKEWCVVPIEQSTS